MKKIKQFKGFVIAQSNKKEISEGHHSEYVLFKQDEWEYGEGCRYPEWDCESIDEAKDFIENYEQQY